MAYHIKNIPCPKCRDQGNDRSGDNLAYYSDDSSYCWNCGYFSNGRISSDRLLDRGNSNVPKALPLILLPSDSDINYPDKALQWVGQYGLNRVDLLNNHAVYSDSNERLIFPFWNGQDLLGWQGRYFGKDPEKIRKNKWFGRGNLNTIYHIFFLGRGGTVTGRHKNYPLVLVEDIISAIKVSKAGYPAMPLFGVNVKSRMSQIRLLNYPEAILWLDPDMHIKMIKECNTARLSGFKMHPVMSDKDPKEHSMEEIQNLLTIRN